ncbi:MAG: MFS transporter [Candidatus Omnitrophota bacterium]
MTRFRDILFKNRNFSLFWLGQVVSNFGDRLTQMALIAFVYQIAPGSSIALAKLTSFTLIPVFVIGPVAGVWADRWDRKTTMIVSDILRGFLVLLIPIFVLMNQIALVYCAVFLLYSVTRFFIPSRMAFIPDLVAGDKLLTANSLANTTRMIGNAIGLVVAGLIVNIKFVGASGGFYIDSATFFFSAALIAMIVSKKAIDRMKHNLAKAGSALGHSIRRSVFAEIKEGIRYLTITGGTRIVAWIFLLFMASLGAIYCVLVVFIQEAFGSATKDLAFFGMFLMGGLFTGTILYGKLGEPFSKRKASFYSFIATGVMIVLFTAGIAHYPGRLLGFGLSFLLGLAASPVTICVNTMVHEVIPDVAWGRVFSSLEAAGHAAFMISMIVASLLSKCVDQGWILAASGVMFGMFGVAGLILERRTA